MNKYKMQEGGQQQPTPEEMAMMQQQQAAQQGGAPQQGGQDQAMQQVMQMVQQMIQQGAQPADIAAELLGQQLPPEAIMQVFVEMGLPEQEAQAAIQQAMQAGPPAEGAPQGQPSPEEMAAMQQQMEKGGLVGDQDKLDVDGDNKLTRKDFASLRQAEFGMMGDPPEGRFTTPPSNTNGQVMDRTTNFLPGNVSFINDDTESLTYAFTGKDDGVQKGIIIPDSMTGTNINRKKLYKEALKNEAAGLETEGNVRFERDATGNVIYSPGIEEEVDTRTVEQKLTDAGGFEMPMQNMEAGGAMFRKLMKKAWGGQLAKPGASSEDYVSDRAAMFVNAIKQNTAMSTLNESMKGDPFAKAGLPSKSLGGLPKFVDEGEVNSETAGDNDLGFTDKQMEYIKNLTSGLNKVQQGIRNPNLQYQGFSGYNPYMTNMTVGYRDPRQFTAYDEIQRGMNPFARLIANSGRTYGAPRITGYNLPGGISGADFLAQMQGMSGVGPDGTPYRVTDVERYKKGNFLTTLNPFKRRERGLRYNIDYGTGLTDGSASDQQTTSTSGSGAMSREDMLNDLNKNERKQFRRLQRGRDAVSANEAYDILKGDRNIPAQDEQTTLEQMRANAAAAGDPLGQQNQIANTAAEVDPALADAGSQEAQGFQPMTEDDLTAQQRRQIKRGKTSLEEINSEAERQFGIDQDIAAAKRAEGTGFDADGNVVPVGEDFANAQMPPSPSMEGVDNSYSYNPNANPFPKRTTPDFSEAQDFTGPAQMTEQLQQKMMLDNYGKGMRTGAPADPGITRMPIKPAFGKPGEPTIVGNVPAATVDLENRMMLDNYGKGMQGSVSTNTMPAVSTEEMIQEDVKSSLGDSANPNRQLTNEEMMTFAQPILDYYNPQSAPSAPATTGSGPIRPATTTASMQNTISNTGLTEDELRQIEIDNMTYGGGVSPEALANAVNLINMAFGGGIPKAVNGMDLQGRLAMEQAIAQQGLNGSGTVDVAQDQGFAIDTNALGQSYMLGAKAINFLDARGEMNRAQDQNALRDQNAINTPESYALSQVGLDNQFGQRFNTNFNSQVLNPTSNVGFGYGGGQYPFPQTMEYGGQYYEIGGDIDLTPEKLAEFEAAGFVLTRK